MSQIEFTRNIIKGKIAETIFEQMIREMGKYTVIPFGYEHTVPTLAQYQHITKVKHVMDNIKDAPDFALVSEDKTELFLVEVKYQQILDYGLLYKYAEKLLERWETPWLFVATSSGFMCSSCNTIKDNKGNIRPLQSSWVDEELQAEYLELLNEFEVKRGSTDPTQD